MKKSCIVLIPVYKEDLDADEFFSVKASLKHLLDFEVLFIGPELLNINYYSKHFPNIQFKYFNKDFFASITDIVGGRSSAYEQVLREAKATAMAEMELQARHLGANAIIGIDLDYETIREGMLMVTVSGTAVKVYT